MNQLYEENKNKNWNGWLSPQTNVKFRFIEDYREP